MKFIWLVKNKITLFENCMILSTGHIDLSFIYTDKFPEIMRFSLKTEITHIFKIVDAVYAVDRENLRQADACIVHGIPPLFAKMYLIFTIQEIGEKEKTEKIKIDSDCANMESKKYTRIEVSVQETNIVYEGQITKWKESLGFRKVEQK